jgi:putative hemolysin
LENGKKKYVDVEGILKTKAPKLIKWMPGFVIRYLKKKLHEDDINIAMAELSKYHGLEFNQKCLEYLKIKVQSIVHEDIPKEGPVIVCSNHPLGGLDGIALIQAVSDFRLDIRFIVNDILLYLKNFGELFVGVNKLGSNARKNLSEIEKIYSSGCAVLIFPAGLVSRKQGRIIKDLEWNKSFISQAVKHKIPVIPVFIEGKNSRFFYRFANFRKFLRIKANLEMMLLPDEMFKQKGKKIKIYFGKKIPPDTFDKRYTHKQWANALKEFVYSDALKKGETFEKFIGL